jgi:L-ascorbate oxidase
MSRKCWIDLLSLLVAFVSLVHAGFHRHDSSFQPDYILVSGAQNISYDCQSRYPIVLNGSSPVPTLYMREGQTTWIRVYNNMSDQNLTVVRSQQGTYGY